MKFFTFIIILSCTGLLTNTTYAQWEVLVNGKNKVWKNNLYKKTYLTQSPSPFFTGKSKIKKELLEIFNIYDWKVLKNKENYILGEYIDPKGKINFFLESKSENSIHISTSRKEVDLHKVYTSFLNRN
jgi:hypothetical protein